MNFIMFFLEKMNFIFLKNNKFYHVDCSKDTSDFKPSPRASESSRPRGSCACGPWRMPQQQLAGAGGKAAGPPLWSLGDP